MALYLTWGGRDEKRTDLAQMDHELRMNRHKGDWTTWRPTPAELVSELNYHLDKLKIALHTGNRPATGEYAADLANLAMKVFTLYGRGEEPNGKVV